MLGFLGSTNDVTGFEFDRNVLLASVVFAVCVQILNNIEPCKDKTNNTDTDSSKR